MGEIDYGIMIIVIEDIQALGDIGVNHLIGERVEK